LFTTASAWVMWIIASSDSPAALGDMPKVLAMMDRVQALDPAIRNGGVDLFHGIYYTVLPLGGGRDLERARAHFERSMDIAGPDYLLARVTYAEFYARYAFDPDLFAATLQAVLAAEPAVPEFTLMNAVAKMRAATLLEQMDEFSSRYRKGDPMMNFQPAIPAVALAAWLAWGPPCSAQVRLNLATLAPEGSIWMQALNDAKAEIETATAGAVRLRIYPGGIMGAEKDVLAKIRMGQLHGGGFMGYAVGVICPDASRADGPAGLAEPRRSRCGLDALRERLAENTRQNGFEAMGWTEVGFSYAYGMKPVANLADLRATKVWGWIPPC
jgi:hypothetical protein